MLINTDLPPQGKIHLQSESIIFLLISCKCLGQAIEEDSANLFKREFFITLSLNICYLKDHISEQGY